MYSELSTNHGLASSNNKSRTVHSWSRNITRICGLLMIYHFISDLFTSSARSAVRIIVAMWCIYCCFCHSAVINEPKIAPQMMNGVYVVDMVLWSMLENFLTNGISWEFVSTRRPHWMAFYPVIGCFKPGIQHFSYYWFLCVRTIY